jgi:histidinol-phosphate/aromatic aminotransferase/cobyric acid decarboxylase-like protein
MMKFLRSGLATFAPYVPGQQPADGESWIKLNTNVSPLSQSDRGDQASQR